MTTPAHPTGPKADPASEPARTGAPALPAKTLPGPDGLRRLPGVVLFAAGRHTDMAGRTREFSRDYLQGVVDRFAALKADPDFHHEPPAVLGHEVVQAKLAEILAGDDTYRKVFGDAKASPGGGPGRTDQLAAGWPDNLRLDGDRLVADLERIPPSVADLIDSGQLRYPSVEFQENRRRADGTPVPPYLHRLALLGGTPPGCKAVPPLGQAHFADAPEGVVFFADAYAADPAANPDGAPADAGEQPPDKPTLALLQTCYPMLSTAFLESLSRKQIDQLAADHVAAQKTAQPNQDPYAAGVTAMADSNPTPDPKAGAKPNAPPAVPPELVAFADGLRAEFAAERKALDETAAAIRKAADDTLAAQNARADAAWADAVNAFCDAELKAGRIAPWELDKADPLNLRARLLTVPAADVISFADADGKPQTKSRREAELDAIRKRPVRMFGDRIPAGTAPQDDERTARKKQIASFYAARNPKASAKN